MSMSRFCAVALLVVLAISQVSAKSISWTGYANNNQWDTENNWYPNSVPGTTDDVTINKGNVIVTSSTGVQSLKMGNSFSAPANLTLFKNFYVGGTMTVEGNGNLFVQAGLDTITGTVNVAGNLFWQGGACAGSWTVGPKAVADLSSKGEKALIGCQFVSQGTLTLGGVIAFNQSSTFTVSGGATATSALSLQAQDKTASLFDSSSSSFAYSGGDLQVQVDANFGDFTVAPGSNVSLFNKIHFGKSVHVANGTYWDTLGSAVVNMSHNVSGGGVLSAAGATIILGGVNMTGFFNSVGGNTSFGAANNQIGVYSLAGGNVQMTNAVAAFQLNVLNGDISGASTLSATNMYAKTNGFNLDSTIAISGTSTIQATTFAVQASGKLVFGSASTSTTSGAFALTGAPGSPGFVNNGVFSTSSFATQNVDISGTGTIKVGSSLTVNSVTVKQGTVTLASGATFKGANTYLGVANVNAKSSVKGVFGDYTVTGTPGFTAVGTPNMSTLPTTKFSFSA